MDPIEGISGAKGIKKVKITSTPIEESGTPKGTNPLEGLFSLLPGSGSKITGQEAYRQQLAQFFPGGAKPVLKDGVLGFNVSGLTADQRTQLKNSLQGFLDQIYGPGVITVTEKGGVIGLDATNLEKNDITALAALLLGRTDPGQVTVSQKSLNGVRNDAGLIEISVQSGTTTGGEVTGNGRVQVPAPAPGAGNRTPAEWTRLAAILSVDTSATLQDANIKTLDVMAELQKATTEENIKQMKESFQKMREAAEKAATWGIFSKIASWAMIVIGAALMLTGVGAAAGAALLVGGLIGLAMTTEVGQKAMAWLVEKITPLVVAYFSTVIDVLQKAGIISEETATSWKAGVKEWGEVIATVYIAILLIIITMGASAGASAAVAATGVGRAVVSTAQAAAQATIRTVLNIINQAVQLATGATDIYFGVSQGILTLQIGDSQEKVMSQQAFLDLLSQGYDVFSKELSKIMDQMTTSISNATSVLQQEGNYASSYKVRTA
jgi:hypothetical protein